MGINTIFYKTLISAGLFFAGIGFFCSLAMASVTDGYFGFVGDPDVPVTEATTTTATSTGASASITAANLISEQQRRSDLNRDVTKPEELSGKVAIITLFEARPVTEPGVFNLMAYWVQESVRQGIPANTIYLVLLTPFLALLVSFVRVVVGLPTLDMLVPIALSFALVAVGISVGMLVLSAIVVASYIAKRVLSPVRIMFYPKRALSMVLLSLSVFAALSVGVVFEFERILNVSIFPILVLMLLGDMIVSVQLHKSPSETFVITSSTILVGLSGYLLATSESIQNTLILYPELVLLVIPANLLIGRYFGLRILEIFRFKQVAID